MYYLTAGESHGACLLGILEGMIAGVTLNHDKLQQELALRQQGPGRGGRMKIEKDYARIVAGVRGSVTTGAPIGIIIENRDSGNWGDVMNVWDSPGGEQVTVPRPGHADLAGAIKYNHTDIRNILERSSARETAMRTAVGAICGQMLENFSVTVSSKVVSVGGNTDIESSVAKASESGDTLGGVVKITVDGLPAGIGSHTDRTRKLDAIIAAELMSVQTVKAVSCGEGIAAAALPGSCVHDEIVYENGYKRLSNNAGGIEGGISNGSSIVFSAFLKPIPTLKKPLKSVDIITREPCDAAYHRSDVTAVHAAAVVCRHAVNFIVADELLKKFGGDSISETLQNFNSYTAYVSSR